MSKQELKIIFSCLLIASFTCFLLAILFSDTDLVTKLASLGFLFGLPCIFGIILLVDEKR